MKKYFAFEENSITMEAVSSVKPLGMTVFS